MPKLKPETLAARKAHILQAALTCFARAGYHKTSMDDIVREAGVSKGGIYTHFESKKAIFLALLDKLVADTEMLPILSAEALTGREKLDAALASIIALTASDVYQDYASLLMDAWIQNQLDTDVNQAIAFLYNRLRQMFIQLIEQSIAAGEFKPVDAAAVANIFIAIFDGLMVQVMIEETAVSWPAIAQTIHDTWMNGLAASES